MNPEIKDKWITALESGEFEQGKGSLADNGRYCCLGVLCELAAREGAVQRFSLGARGAAYGALKLTGVLPTEVEEWAGLPASCHGAPYIMDMSITDWNDHKGKTFNELAIMIKEHL